jgi:tryptophan synthase beta chain
MRTRMLLNDAEMPRFWYNITADLPTALAPALDPKNLSPVSGEQLAPIFPRALIEQEITSERWVAIPEEVRDVYSLWRPTPLIRARALERALDTPAEIYYKYEGVSPSGSHKPNTAVAQAFYNKIEGVKKVTTETGAGQWGSALSFACQKFGLACEVFMVRISFEQKPYRRVLMNSWGATVHASPTELTNSGRRALRIDPRSPGSLGIAISEAVEVAASDPHSKYALGSVLNHVLLHQTIVGQEAVRQMEGFGIIPDVVIAPFGGGSNFGGLSLPFLRMNLTEGHRIRFIAAEPTACPTLTRGDFRYDYGDTEGLTPLLPMYTLGHDFIPASIHAGGLRYHGAAPIISHLVHEKLMEAKAVDQITAFEAGLRFARAEGIVPAPEAMHAIAVAMEEAMQAKEEGRKRVILFNLCGHGHFDMAAYEAFLAGRLERYEMADAEIAAALGRLSTPAVGQGQRG